MNVGIINYGMGNLTSVKNAFDIICSKVSVIDDPNKLSEFSHIVLPGVGAFGKGINNITKYGWDECLNKEVIINKKPFLGICLGMQLIATKGFELGEHKGLDWLSGTVEKLKTKKKVYRIPHIGWNDVIIKNEKGIYSGIEGSATFYFLHSYIVIPENKTLVSGITNHGQEFAASIEFENIMATQFHPEKSQKVGIKILKNFTNIKTC